MKTKRVNNQEAPPECKSPDCPDAPVYRGYCRKCYLKVTYGTIKLLKEAPQGEEEDWAPVIHVDEDEESEISNIIRRKAA